MNKAIKSWNAHRMERWSDSSNMKRHVKKMRRKAARRRDRALCEEV